MRHSAFWRFILVVSSVVTVDLADRDIDIASFDSEQDGSAEQQGELNDVTGSVKEAVEVARKLHEAEKQATATEARRAHIRDKTRAKELAASRIRDLSSRSEEANVLEKPEAEILTGEIHAQSVAAESAAADSSQNRSEEIAALQDGGLAVAASASSLAAVLQHGAEKSAEAAPVPPAGATAAGATAAGATAVEDGAAAAAPAAAGGAAATPLSTLHLAPVSLLEIGRSDGAETYYDEFRKETARSLQNPWLREEHLLRNAVASPGYEPPGRDWQSDRTADEEQQGRGWQPEGRGWQPEGRGWQPERSGRQPENGGASLLQESEGRVRHDRAHARVRGASASEAAAHFEFQHPHRLDLGYEQHPQQGAADDDREQMAEALREALKDRNRLIRENAHLRHMSYGQRPELLAQRGSRSRQAVVPEVDAQRPEASSAGIDDGARDGVADDTFTGAAEGPDGPELQSGPFSESLESAKRLNNAVAKIGWSMKEEVPEAFQQTMYGADTYRDAMGRLQQTKEAIGSGISSLPSGARAVHERYGAEITDALAGEAFERGRRPHGGGPYY